MFSAEYLRGPDGAKVFRRRSFVACAAAELGAIACFLLAHASGEDLPVKGRGTGSADVPLGAVVFATLLAFGAAVAMAVLARRAPRPRLVFLALAAIGAILTTIPPITAAADAANAAWLLAMHAIVAASIVPALASSLRVRRNDVPHAATSSHK